MRTPRKSAALTSGRPSRHIPTRAALQRLMRRHLMISAVGRSGWHWRGVMCQLFYPAFRLWRDRLSCCCTSWKANFVGKRIRRSTFQWKKGFFSEEGGRHFSEWAAWEGFLQERQFSEEVWPIQNRQTLKIEKLLSSSPCPQNHLLHEFQERKKHININLFGRRPLRWPGGLPTGRPGVKVLCTVLGTQRT